MNFFHARLLALEAWFVRRTTFLDQPRILKRALWFVPIMLGLVSVGLGQDDGWDMRNYHLYNAHTLMHGRVGMDMAAAGFQGYFNPTIELPYYFLNLWLPAPLVGFVLGAVHGLNFVLLLGIARSLLGERPRQVLLVALACLFVPGFLSELGNTMGDNLTALFVLASLYLVLRWWQALPHWNGRIALVMALAGLSMGVGTGLKLTNAVYGLALGLALLTLSLPWWQRLRLAATWGMGALAGIAATAGWWFFKMYQLFGNPLFPQFNNLFRSPYTGTEGVIDFYFRPRDWMENLLWPFIFTSTPRRVSELSMQLAVWPVLYVLVGVFVLVWLARRLRGGATGMVPRFEPCAAFVLWFVVIGYVVWMRMFGIYRYVVPIELLAPLMIWMIWRYIAPAVQQPGAVLLAVLAVGVFPIANWGHQSWARQAFRADVPSIAQPAQTIVFLPQANPPPGWMATFFPPQVKFIALGASFPQTPLWDQQRTVALAERSGPHYVLVTANKNDKDGSRLRKLAIAETLGWTQDASGCSKLARVIKVGRQQVVLRTLPTGGCTLDLLPQHQVDLAALDRQLLETTARQVSSYGLQLETASCTMQPAFVGQGAYPYWWCRVTPVP